VETHKLSDMIKGWFVGDFEPTVFKTKDVEVALKYYKSGDTEQRHVHKIATEITVVIFGLATMNGKELEKGSIVVIEPNESTDFVATTNTATVCVKVPSVKGDKYDSDI